MEEKKEEVTGTLRKDKTLLRDEKKMEKLKQKLHTDDERKQTRPEEGIGNHGGGGQPFMPYVPNACCLQGPLSLPRVGAFVIITQSPPLRELRVLMRARRA